MIGGKEGQTGRTRQPEIQALICTLYAPCTRKRVSQNWL